MRAAICWDVDEGAWSRFFESCPDASPFHGPAWHHAWQVESGAAIVPVRFRFDDGRQAMAILALSRAYRGLGKMARSGVAGGYGGLIAPVPLSDHQVDLAFGALRRRYPYLVVQGSPHVSWPNVSTRGASAARTLVLDLADLSTLRQGYNQNRRREARNAGHYSIWTCVQPSADALAPFLDLYRRASERWAFDRHRRSDAFWLALGRHLGADLVLHLVSDNGVPAAARLVARRGAIAYDLAFVIDPDHRKHQAATAVTEAALVHAHATGAGRFDFMPSGQLEGVYRFKASLGAAPLPLLETRYSRGLTRILGLARRMLRHA